LIPELSLKKRLFVDIEQREGIQNGSEEEQRSFDSTFRKLHRFLSQPQR